MPLQLPIDLTSLPPFRLLEAALGPARALWLWWVVWRELAYLMEEGCAPGRIRAEDQKTFMAALTVPECSTSSGRPLGLAAFQPTVEGGRAGLGVRPVFAAA